MPAIKATSHVCGTACDAAVRRDVVDATNEARQMVGFYTQPYNEITKPGRVWRVPKYFLRRWGPYLTPSRFWTIVAARQFAYWNDDAHWCEVYDKRFSDEAGLSTIHYRRIKAEMEEAANPLSLFIRKENTQYEFIDGQTKPKPTKYYIRLDDPLTPADAHHLATWFQTHDIPRRANDVAAFLKEVRQYSRKNLLAPTLAPYLAAMPAQFRTLSIQDVVGQVFGPNVAKNKAVQKEAETLHNYLTGTDYFGKEYFRCNWLPRLKPGPAFLVTYLRSLCYHNEKTGEIRNQVTFTRPDLADSLGVDPRTISRWLKSIQKATPKQSINSFLQLIEKKRGSSNEVEFTYEVEIVLEPLTEDDLTLYETRISEIESPQSAANDSAKGQSDSLALPTKGESEGQNDSLTSSPNQEAEGQNESYAPSTNKGSEGQNDSLTNLPEHLAEGQNDSHDPPRKDKMIRGEGQNDSGRRTKRVAFKYYKTLFQLLSNEDVNTLLTAAAEISPKWQVENDLALQPFGQAAAGNNINTLFDLLDIDEGGPSRQRIREGGLDLNAIAAWHLYALNQKGLQKAPVTLTIKRSLAGKQPPKKYLQLAGLSWELWRCYAALLVLPPTYHNDFRNAPAYDLWMNVYGRCHPNDLPFGVGVGVSETVNDIRYKRTTPHLVKQTNTNTDIDIAKRWQPVLDEVALSMTKATFNTWLKDAILINVQPDGEGEQWTVAVRNEYAQDWLSNRLDTSIRRIASAISGQPITISYVVCS